MSRRKYTFQQRLEVVMHYFATDEGYRLTSARFNVPRTQVRIWVAAYDAYGEEGLKPRDKGVSIAPDIRVEAVKAVLTGQISQTQAGLAPIFPYTFYHLTHDWFVAADIPVGNDIPVHYADAIRCNVRRPPQGSLPLLTRRASA